MANNQAQEKIMSVLDWAYEKAVDGGIGLDSAEEMANDYLKLDGDVYEQANSNSLAKHKSGNLWI